MVRLVYFSAFATCVLGATTVLAYRSARTLPSEARRFGYAAVGTAAAMFLAYVGMTTIQTFFEQTGVPLLLMELSRFVGYTLLWLPVVYVTTRVAGASRRFSTWLFVAIAGQLWLVFFAWKAKEVPQWLVLVSPAVLLVGTALLYGPVTRAAGSRSEARTTLFNKLKHVVFLGWFGQVMTVVVHPSTLGLTSISTDWVTLMYVELLLVCAFVALVLGHQTVLASVGNRPSTDADASGADAGEHPVESETGAGV